MVSDDGPERDRAGPGISSLGVGLIDSRAIRLLTDFFIEFSIHRLRDRVT